MSMFSKISGLRTFLRSARIYRDRYGWAPSLRLAYRLRQAYLENSDSLPAIAVPGLHSPVYVRPRSVDTRVFREIFGHQPFRLDFDPPPRFIVDAGAHIGLTSVYFANRFPSARIVSLEVEAGNYAMLVRNTAPYDNVIPLHKGLWSHKSELQLDDASVETWAFSVSESRGPASQTIPSLGIANIMREYGADELDLLKLDIEGAEKEVFSRNYEQWIDHVRVIAVELHDWLKPGCSSALDHAISGRNFEISRKGDYVLLTSGNVGTSGPRTTPAGNGAADEL